ncbi:MAG: hypothetical protein LUG15_08210, partial [Oscillospiraceae bacterium]|nr:hypothetical protein [Oscillospiraceae bacterium]
VLCIRRPAREPRIARRAADTQDIATQEKRLAVAFRQPRLGGSGSAPAEKCVAPAMAALVWDKK